MRVLRWPRQHDNRAIAARRQCETASGRIHAGKRAKLRAKPAHLDAQPRPMRLVGMGGAERARKERVTRHVPGPRFTERPCEREQHRSSGQRNHGACIAHRVTARIDDQRVRCQHILDLGEPNRTLLAIGNQACGRRVQDRQCGVDLGQERRNTCTACRMGGPFEGGQRRPRPHASQRDTGDDELVSSAGRGRERCRIERSKRQFGLIHSPDQEQAPYLEMPAHVRR